jgi:hypothetical protein
MGWCDITLTRALNFPQAGGFLDQGQEMLNGSKILNGVGLHIRACSCGCNHACEGVILKYNVLIQYVIRKKEKRKNKYMSHWF